MSSRELILLVLVTAGALTDLRTGKIYNSLTYPTCVLGLTLGWAESGWQGFSGSLQGLAFAFLPFFLLYLCGGLGGGDVKLMAAVGALMGLEFAAITMVHSVLFGALIACLLVVWNGRARVILGSLWAILSNRSRRDAVSNAGRSMQVPFGVAICLASFTTLLSWWQGARSPWHLAFF